MPGYDENFLDVRVPLPTFSPELSEWILEKPSLRDSIYAEYVNYTVVMNKERRAPVFAALNINQKLMRTVDRRGFRLDRSRVGKKFQLGPKYYYKNPYDKGHLAMRHNAAWGKTDKEAQLASDETHYYTNASLQHENFNKDEWVSLEQWVGSLKLDLDDKISSFSGPIYGHFSRTVTVVTPTGRQCAAVPAAFFKVIFFINKHTEKLDVKAFIVVQDKEARKNREGRKIYDAQSYQTTVREIQEKTGLIFEDAIAETNPLLYTDSEDRRRDFGISHFPERIEIDRPEEIIDGSEPRVYNAEDEIDVFIAAALVNPEGPERKNEWISLLNLDNKDIDLSKWTLKTIPNHTVESKKQFPQLELGTVLPKNRRLLGHGEAIRVQPIAPLQLNNRGATIVLKDDAKRQIDRVKYTRSDVKSGKTVKLYEYEA